ncbi:MAG: hypothetical protein ACRD26_18655 [Vicinamibacterales bacterium]
MRILFLMQHAGFTFYYDAVLRTLAERGHDLVVAHERAQASEQLARLTSECAAVTSEELPKYRDWRWRAFSGHLRTFQDYLRYLEPRYAHATYLRRRVEENVPRGLQRLGRAVRRLGPWAVAALQGVLRVAERLIPVPPEVRAFIADRRPDVVLVTPLVDVGSRQVDYLKAASALGIRTGLCVASWDNLTNKGLMRVVPDRVFVWNETQRREAVEMHRVPPARVVVTGAQAFDHWFTWAPSCSREEFCRRVGLAPDQPYLLFVGSTVGIAADEPAYVEKWIRAMRLSGQPGLHLAGVLVRPHPKQQARWEGVDLAGTGNTRIQPARTPADPASRTEYYDALVHSAAVVGVNTSALIEAAIAGREVYTLLAPEFAETQEGTLHFQYLAAEHGGPLHTAREPQEHFRQLGAALRSQRAGDARSRDFVRSFVRPHGLDVPATPILAGAIEALGRGEADYAPGFVPKTVQL